MHVKEGRTFAIGPLDPVRQREEIHHLIGMAVASGASIVLLPELCLTEDLAVDLEQWVPLSGGPRLLMAGTFHHEDDHGLESGVPRRRNTALTWLWGHNGPLVHDKHSPADRPVVEDIQPLGWPELRVYVSSDECHLVTAICLDLLNPQAVHAVAEVGANLVLVPAMSETLMAFGGPVAAGSVPRMSITSPSRPRWFGLSGILYGELAFFGILVALPFVDRNPERFWRRRPVAMALGLLGLLAIIALTVQMAVTLAKQHLGM